jgi:hypothetical protein
LNKVIDLNNCSLSVNNRSEVTMEILKQIIIY